MRSPHYLQGFREASKLAVELVHSYANECNDPSARKILDARALELGIDLKKAHLQRATKDLQ